jgi:hypothetical protein
LNNETTKIFPAKENGLRSAWQECKNKRRKKLGFIFNDNSFTYLLKKWSKGRALKKNNYLNPLRLRQIAQ